MINNNLKAPYSDQFSLGIRNKVGDWNTDATVARIVSKDGFVFTLGNRYPNGAFWTERRSQPWGNGVPGFGNLIIGNNGIETRNTQLLLSADKPYTKESGWAATFAYTYTHATQNRDINEHYSFDEETIHQYPFIDFQRGAEAPLRRDRIDRRSVGLHVLGQADPGHADAAQRSRSAASCPDGTRYPTGSNCHADRGHVERQLFGNRSPTPPAAQRSCSAARSSATARSTSPSTRTSI